jgi:hypothetical protein
VLVTSSAVDGVTSAVQALVQQPPADLPDVVVLSNLEQLLVLRSQLDAVMGQHLAVADSRDATVTECGRGTRAWLVEEQQVERGLAARKMRVARQLWRWPATEAAWLSGDISEDHVLVIVTALKAVPGTVAELVEKTLLDLASDSAPHLVAEAIDAILVACGVEKSSDAAAARRYGARGVTFAPTFAGTGSLSGTLTAVLTDKLTRALEYAGKPAGPEDDRTRAQRFHDAFEQIVDHYLDTAELPKQDHGERPARVIVTLDLPTLEGRLESGWGLLPTGARVSPATARRLACDAEVIPVVLGSASDMVSRSVLDMGKPTRLFSEKVRRLAVLRDGDRCVFPACQNSRQECHHIKHWADGGQSDLDNAAWLCAFHHWLLHERGWTLRREVDGGYTFTSPAGKQCTSSNAPTSFWDDPPDGGQPAIPDTHAWT